MADDDNENSDLVCDDPTLISIDPTLAASHEDHSRQMCAIDVVVNSCPLMSRNPPNALYPIRPNSATCKFSALKIVSGSRQLNLTENKSYIRRRDKEILEVVAGVTRDKKNITVSLNGAAGPCQQHKKNIRISPAIADNIEGTTSVNYEAAAVDVDSILARLWPKSMSTESIRVIGSTCGHLTNSRIIVYPDASWDISFAFKYDKDTSRFKFDKFQVKHKYNGHTEVISMSSLPRPLDEFLELLFAVINVLSGIKQVYRDITGEEHDEEYGFKVDYPAIEFSGKWGWEEDSGTTLCKYPVSLKFKLDPLIGFTYKADILEKLINTWPGVGAIINFIRSRIDDSVHLAIDFEIKGKISKSGEVSFDLGSVERSVIVEGNAALQTYSISFTLTGSASFDVLIVQCGASIEGNSSFSFDFVKIGADRKGAYVQFPVTWSGLVVKGIIYQGTESTVSNGEPRRRGRAKKAHKSERILLKVDEKKFFKDKLYTNN